MILGILSDTHGEIARTASALRLLQRVGAEAYVHCGDVGGEEVLDEFVGRQAWIVAGNMDGSGRSLGRYAALVGLTVRPGPLRLDLDGRRLAVFHGHERELPKLLDDKPGGAAVRAKFADCDYILHGHTHVPRDTRVGRWRVVNPGALYRARTHTVATLDVASDALRFWRVIDEPDGAPPESVELADISKGYV